MFKNATKHLYAFKKNLNNDNLFPSISLILFTVYFSTFYTPFVPSVRMRAVLLGLIVLLMFWDRYIRKAEIISFKYNEILLACFLIVIVASGLQNINGFIFQDLVIYSLLILYLHLSKVQLTNYRVPFKIIFYLSILYAISVLFQYGFLTVYLEHVLPLFPVERFDSILRLTAEDAYSGLTHQTAYTAGYILNGIGLTWIMFDMKRPIWDRVLKVGILLLLFAGLLLTDKRAHLLFSLIALLVVYLVSTSTRALLLRKVKMLIYLFGASALLITVVYAFNIAEGSFIRMPIDMVAHNVISLFSGEDISSGRTVLYREAWQYFLDNPIFGMGWRQFREHSLGLISNNFYFHPHNMYLQLLSELGILGFLFFVIPLFTLYFKTIVLSNRLIRGQIKDNGFDITCIKFALYLQTFFILYGVTGNVLTDFNFLASYFFSVTLSLSLLYKYKDVNERQFFVKAIPIKKWVNFTK